MGSDKILLRNIAIAATVVIASIVLFSIVGNTGEKSEGHSTCSEIYPEFALEPEFPPYREVQGPFGASVEATRRKAAGFISRSAS